MSVKRQRLSAEEIEAFLVGRPTYAFDPTTCKRAATVTYDADGTCRVVLEEGGEDAGQWGITDDTYWTRYDTFRGGSRNVFYLSWVSADVAQAFYADGRRAFLQSGHIALDGVDDANT